MPNMELFPPESGIQDIKFASELIFHCSDKCHDQGKIKKNNNLAYKTV